MTPSSCSVCNDTGVYRRRKWNGGNLIEFDSDCDCPKGNEIAKLTEAEADAGVYRDRNEEYP